MANRNPFAAAAENAQRGRIRAGGRASSAMWAGADTSRLMSDWLVGNFSTDFEIRSNLRLLRGRARQLVRDNPWIAGFVDELANNVVGPDGILLQAKITTAARPGFPATLASATNKEIERGWKEWGYPEYASADGHDSWTELQRLIMQTIAIDGEVLRPSDSRLRQPLRYTLQLLDADLVDEMWNVPRGIGQNQIRMGVEIDQ
jgi:capsid protein